MQLPRQFHPVIKSCVFAVSCATGVQSSDEHPLASSGGSEAVRFGPLELSRDDGPTNLKRIHELIQAIYYQRFTAALPPTAFAPTWKEVTQALHDLVKPARGNPALLFPLGVELYHWFFFRWRCGEGIAEMDDESLELSAELVAESLEMEPSCHSRSQVSRQALELFLSKGCDYRWTHLVMVEAELGRELAHRRADVARAAHVIRNSAAHFREMMSMPYFAQRRWASPYDMNYNEELYPSPGPVWPSSALPLVSWLEENFATFRSDLDAIRAVPGLFDELHQLERNAEGQDHAREEDWTVVELADTREDEPWKERICAHARRSCDLLRARPELQCDHAAAYMNRMRSGAWIKPHMGNPPRLVVHLGLDVPPEPIELYVGNARLRWQTGKAQVIDDTYVHSVRHYGLPDQGPERYILHVLICHPCEPSQRELYADSEGFSCR